MKSRDIVSATNARWSSNGSRLHGAIRLAQGRIKARIDREGPLHKAIVDMIRAEAAAGVFAFHPANGGWRSQREAARLKAQGVTPGVPDIIVIANGRALGIEVKAKGGSLSKAQREMRDRFAAASTPYFVARSVEDARAFLLKHQCLKDQK